MFTAKLKHLNAVLAAGLLMMLSQGAFALGTASGTLVTNNVSVDYQVSGVSQPTVNDSASFDVDNAINVDVVATGNINVAPNAANQILEFTITNNGNTTQGYALDVEQDGASTFTMNNVTVYLDNGCAVAGTWDATCTVYGGGATDNAGDLAADDSMYVWIVADVPPNGGGVAPTNGLVDTYNLLATTLDSGTAVNAAGSVTTDNSTDLWDPNILQVVYREGTAGNHSADTDDDGADSASATYTAVTATLVVSKAAAVTADGFSPAGFEKAIPGATVTYTITLDNCAGGTNATNLTITDTIPEATLTYQANTVDVSITSANCVTAGGGGIDNNITDGNTGVNTNAQVTVSDAGGAAENDTITIDGAAFIVPAGERVTITFDTLID